MQPEIPADVTVHHMEIADYWLDAEGILNSVSKNIQRTVANTKASIEMVQRISGGQPLLHLVYMCPSPVPDKATRAYVARELPKAYRAMALVSDSGLGKIVMNFLFGFTRPSVPMKCFSNPQAAKAWLRGFG